MEAVKSIWLGTKEITADDIYQAERILINHGVPVDEASQVVQTLGFILLDTELYASN